MTWRRAISIRCLRDLKRRIHFAEAVAMDTWARLQARSVITYPARVPRMLSFFSSFATVCERSEPQISKLSKVITCTTKHVVWQISHDFGDKYPMTLTTNVLRERKQIFIENGGFLKITRILLQIQCYLCICSSFAQNLSISNHYFVFSRQVMEKFHIC